MKVTTRDELVAFAKGLAADFRKDPGAWENATVDAYLDAFAAWVEDMDGYYANRGEPEPTTPSWRVVADMLMAAKMYE
jgi:hypothetical protein